VLGVTGKGHLDANGPCRQKHTCQPDFMVLQGQIAHEQGLKFQIWMLTGIVRQYLDAQVILRWSVHGSSEHQSSTVETHRHVFAPRGLLTRQGWQKRRKKWPRVVEKFTGGHTKPAPEWRRHPGLQLPP